MIYPEIWKIARQEIVGGWRLAGKNEVSVPIVAGGSFAKIEFEFQASKPIRVEVGLDEEGSKTVIGELGMTHPPEWERFVFEAVPWRSGANLTVRLVPGIGQTAAQGSLILDRARFTWE